MNSSWSVKYRPRTLEQMVGQKGAIAQIRGFCKSKNFPQAILITGKVGSGKTSLARLIATLVNGQEKSSKNDENITEVNVGDQRNIDAIRDLVASTRFLSVSGRYKVIILDEVHALTTISSHALLKSLEEPPPHVIYILCTNQPQSLLESVRSRCVPFGLSLLTTEEISTLLQWIIGQEKLDFGVKKKLLLTKIAQVSAGQARIAIQLLQAVANIWRGGETTKTDQLLEMALVQTNVYGVETVATKFLLSLYRAKWSIALATLGDTNNQGTLLNLLLDLNYHLVARLANQPNLISNWAQREFYKVLQEFRVVPSLAQALQIHQHLVEAKLTAGKYLIEEYHLLISLIAKITSQETTHGPK